MVIVNTARDINSKRMGDALAHKRANPLSCLIRTGLGKGRAIKGRFNRAVIIRREACFEGCEEV